MVRYLLLLLPSAGHFYKWIQYWTLEEEQTESCGLKNWTTKQFYWQVKVPIQVILFLLHIRWLLLIVQP